MKKCLYDLWMDGDKEGNNLNQFTIAIFKAFVYADGENKSKIINAWPDWFQDSQNL